MFDTLGNRLNEVFDRLRGRGALSEDDVAAAMREIRIALLEADVALPVVRDFIAAVREKAVGQEVLRSVTPGQMVVKIVHDHLVAVLGGDEPRGTGDGLDLNAPPPVAILLVGLQGSGKTTTAAKIALRLKNRERKKVLMAGLDVQRPAAQEQLAQLGRQTGVATLPIVAGERPVAITRRALQVGRTEGYDVVLLDTAGRLHVNEELMLEVAAVKEAANPHQTLLVADAMTGQDAVNVAQAFGERAGITGIVLTRVDGDARGGAALSMRAITGQTDRPHRHRREIGRARTVPPRADRRAHPRHGRHRRASSRRPPKPPTRTRPSGSPPSCRKAISISTIWPANCARSAGWAAWAGCSGCCPGWAGSRSSWPAPISTRAS